MQTTKNKSKTITIAIIFLLIASAISIAVPAQPVQAQLVAKQPYSGPIQTGDVANGTFATQTWISARPKVVGLGQTVLINVWSTPASNAGRKLLGYHITITKPDGTKDEFTQDSERDTAATWLDYVPDQLGEYKYKVDFPGTFLPAGVYNDGVIYVDSAAAGAGYQGVPTIYTGSTYYQPDSSPTYAFTVQQDMVWSWGALSAPTDYWTRPVAPELREWLPIIGDWPWYGPAGPDFYTLYPNDSPYWTPRTDFYPYVQGPSSAHVAWKQVQNIAGITGSGRYAKYGAEGWSYDVPFATTTSSPSQITMVIGGRGFMTVPRVRGQMINGSLQQVSTTALQCVDIRTGNVLWEVDGFTHSQGLSSFGSWIFGGAIEYPSTIVYLDGSRLCKYNANTGAQTLNISISPLTSAIHYMNGYALGVQDLGSSQGANRYRLINFTTSGTSTNFTARITNNITWPLSSVPATTDYTLGIAASFGRGLIGSTGTTTEQRLVTVSLRTGQVLVNKSIAPAGSQEFMGYSGASDVCDHGIYAFLTAWGQFKGLDINTGNLVWTSDKMDEQWDCNGFGAYDTTSAYGMFYRAAYSGIYAFDWKTGKIVWKYEAPAISPFETPYIDKNGTTVNSFNGDIFASGDGKIYSINTEHTPTQPITRGWQLHCINATTGQGIFKTIQTGSMGAIADGYLAIADSYTGTLMVYGKGKSQTTVTAPDIAVPQGTAVVIKGTVTDLSPAQPGTPCVSKESMSTQMEYLHRQMPIGGLWGNVTITGVPVILTAIDPNGNTINIGTATSNGYYGTYSYTWTPPNEGNYQILATFAGDESYGSSGASTAISVGPAPVVPTQAPTPTPLSNPPYETYTVGSAIAIIIAVAIATLLILRKRP
jgi:hypothetical protein